MGPSLVIVALTLSPDEPTRRVPLGQHNAWMSVERRDDATQRPSARSVMRLRAAESTTNEFRSKCLIVTTVVTWREERKGRKRER